MYAIQSLTINVLVPNQRTLFSSNSHNFTFLNVDLHFILLALVRNLIKVILKGCNIFRRVNDPI